jgi:hypothetical protein
VSSDACSLDKIADQGMTLGEVRLPFAVRDIVSFLHQLVDGSEQVEPI